MMGVRNLHLLNRSPHEGVHLLGATSWPLYLPPWRRHSEKGGRYEVSLGVKSLKSTEVKIDKLTQVLRLAHNTKPHGGSTETSGQQRLHKCPWALCTTPISRQLGMSGQRGHENGRKTRSAEGFQLGSKACHLRQFRVLGLGDRHE
jgi:hypothetical protein